MTVNLNFFKQFFSPLLEINPTVSNSSLTGAIRCNIPNFKGHIQISDRSVHLFQLEGDRTIGKPAKVIYISPYGFWTDLLITIIRVFTGIVFSSPIRNEDLLSGLPIGRRITIFCSWDGKEAEVLNEVDQKPLFHRLFRTALAN